MDNLRLHAVAAHVVAWHNRHPLARRITAAQVNALGYVALPYTAPGLPPPPEVAPVLPTPVAIEPAIEFAIETEDSSAIVIDVDPELHAEPKAEAAATASPRAATPASTLRSRVAARDADPAAPTGGTDDATPAPAPASAVHGLPRTLVFSQDLGAPTPLPQVMAWVRANGLALPCDPTDGPVRHFDVDPALLPTGAGLARLWAATAAIEMGGLRTQVLVGAGPGGGPPAVLGRRLWSPVRLAAAVLLPVLLVAAVCAVLLRSPPTVEVVAAAAAAAASSSSSSSATAPDPGASAAVLDADPHSGQAGGAMIPSLPAASAPKATAAALPTVMFGLSTRLLRTRAEAEQLQAAFQVLLGDTPGALLRVEMLATGDDWRVVCWPYLRREDAERARALLQARGLRVELVDF